MASQENFWFSLLCTCFSLILYQMCLWYWKNHHLQLEKFWRYFLKDGKSAYFGSSLVLHFLSFVILFVTRLCFEVIDQIRLNFLWKILIFSFVVRHSSHFQKSFTMAPWWKSYITENMDNSNQGKPQYYYHESTICACQQTNRKCRKEMHLSCMRKGFMILTWAVM